jgi:integrase
MARRKRARRVWGSGCVWEKEGRWFIQWRENGQRKSKSFPSEDVARKVLAKIIDDVAAGRAGLPVVREAPTLKVLSTDWLERRKQTNRSAHNDVSRWKHLSPTFDHLKPAEVNAANLRRFIEIKLTEISPATVGHCIRLISALFTDLVEQGYVQTNPVASLPRSTRRLYRSQHDVSKTPFLSKQSDIENVFRALSEPHNVIFAVGCMAGLRVGEILGLHWEDVNLEERRIRVHQQAQNGRLTCTKTGDARLVPISSSLAPVLTQWKLRTGGKGLMFTPSRPNRGGRPDLGSAPTFVRPHTVHAALATALEDCKLPPMTLYQCTRHTYASHFVMAGGSLELLAKVLGHSSVSTSLHYAHLLPDYFGKAHDLVTANLACGPQGTVIALPSRSSATTATSRADSAQQNTA